jgi:hypothetical protein
VPRGPHGVFRAAADTMTLRIGGALPWSLRSPVVIYPLPYTSPFGAILPPANKGLGEVSSIRSFR